MSELAFLCLSVVLCILELAHLVFISLKNNLIIGVRLVDSPSILIGNLQLTYSLLLLLIEYPQLIILLLILANSHKQMGIRLLLSHELLHNFSYVRIVGLKSNVLKAILYVSIVGHFSAHSFLKKC